MNRRRSVVIVGCGFVGTAVARQLAGRLPPELDLTLTSEDSHTTFNPLLPEAVGALPFPEQDLGHVFPYRNHAPGLSRQPPLHRPEQAHDVLRPSAPTPCRSTERARRNDHRHATRPAAAVHVRRQ
jgi:hypothetical protein